MSVASEVWHFTGFWQFCQMLVLACLVIVGMRKPTKHIILVVAQLIWFFAAGGAALSADTGNMGALPAEASSHAAAPPVLSEHDALLGLVPQSDATHVAVKSGNWHDPRTWRNQTPPSDGAKVVIPDGVRVIYDVVSDARLFTLRVDGVLEFATKSSSKMVFDTLVISRTGHIVIGTENDPVRPEAKIELVVADNGPINVRWDGGLISRGFVSHGRVSIHGARKDSHQKVVVNPMAGDDSVEFSEVPYGWSVGDRIVVAGTHYDGYKWDDTIKMIAHHPSEDEVRKIAKIDKNGTVWLDEPLVFNHDAPRNDLRTSVANLTRNVSISSEKEQHSSIYARGHVMFMHSSNVDVRYAEFRELGRTDKSTKSKDASDYPTIKFDSNVQGRYALHLHRAGTLRTDDHIMLVGNAVSGSPGWGIVHHDSRAHIENNVTFSTYGAGYVAETGNETGTWKDNIAIYAQGVSWGIPKVTTKISEDAFDTARGGHGFWFQGRLVASVGNVAASVNTGFVYFHRDGDNRMIPVPAENTGHDQAFHFSEKVKVDKVPILDFRGNEVFASKEGLHIVKANPNQGHDIWSRLEDFLAWSVQSGAHIEYTSHYILSDFTIIGKGHTKYSKPKTGFSTGPNTSELILTRFSISGFETGMSLQKKFVNESESPQKHAYMIFAPRFSEVKNEFEYFDEKLDKVFEDPPNDRSNQATVLNLETADVLSGGGWPYAISFTGTKIDSLGSVRYPGGTDKVLLRKSDIESILKKNGYFRNEAGRPFIIAHLYTTDRGTGRLGAHKVKVYLQDQSFDLQSFRSRVSEGASEMPVFVTSF